jgi:hypothetical protein
MLLGNKEKTIRLHAENFLWGNLTFDYGLAEDERQMLAGSSKNLEEAFQRWLVSEDENDQSLNHKQFTEKLYYMILGWHIRGRLKGKLVDIDLELENTRLKDENMKLTLQNQEYRKDLIKAVGELKDKTELIEQYEKSHYGSKQ